MKKQPEAEYGFWAVALDSMNTRVGASINVHLREPARAWIPEDEPIVCSTTMLELEGACFLPDERKGDRFQLTVYAETKIPEKVGDHRELDAKGMPVWHKRGDTRVPVYRRPLGIATLEKSRGERRWKTCAFLSPATVDAMRQLMYATRPLYLAIHERKTDRKRWAQDITLQTMMPEWRLLHGDRIVVRIPGHVRILLRLIINIERHGRALC